MASCCKATHLKKAVADLERMEDMLIDPVRKSAGSAGEQAAAAWAPVLERLNAGGTASGTQAASAAEQFAQQMQQMQTALRGSRAAGLRAAQTLAESYGALVSGVLIGMSDAMRKAAAAPGPGKGRKGGG